ncbi:VOC family protein [Streptomyces sp. NRRL F-5123]|uniref:VOC family protein n=1 Tax=Streptomyces sp. NRRL F-5123 TaxID=1463856 RepID=UPI00131BD953|nr:VOC family protein [Streptomyces sp. NRRL F-5123]
MAGGVVAVVVDAVDAEGLARFWAAALEWPAGPGAVVRPPGGGVELRFAGGAGAKGGKNRLHLDLAGGGRQEATVRRLLGLGAVRADIGQGDVPWEVLADPEGNELCVLPEHRGAPGAALAQICLDAADAEAQGRFWSAATGWAVTGRGEWGVCLRDPAGAGPALVMGPPAAPKSGRNRLRLRLAAAPPGHAGALADPEGNEFEVGGWCCDREGLPGACGVRCGASQGAGSAS